MGIRLISLRGMPEDEYADICALLDENDVAYYETPPSNWFISAGAIWLTNENQLQLAQDLLEAYQRKRAAKARAEYNQEYAGQFSALVRKFLDNPLLFIIYLAVVVFVIYISVKPFVYFGR
jgi:hypothetical protein